MIVVVMIFPFPFLEEDEKPLVQWKALLYGSQDGMQSTDHGYISKF